MPCLRQTDTCADPITRTAIKRLDKAVLIEADIDLSSQLLEGAGVELSRACRASALERNVRENLYL
jgi:hypothetical protein